MGAVCSLSDHDHDDHDYDDHDDDHDENDHDDDHDECSDKPLWVRSVRCAGNALRRPPMGSRGPPGPFPP